MADSSNSLGLDNKDSSLCNKSDDEKKFRSSSSYFWTSCGIYFSVGCIFSYTFIGVVYISVWVISCIKDWF